MNKTNAMRMLDRAKIEYKAIEYEVDDSDLSGVRVAQSVGLDCKMVFKTIVAKGDRTGPLVMCIPVDMEIDLKKAASVSGNKKIEMVHVKDLLSLTGYIRGGCSPVGMKKSFPTFFDKSCEELEQMTISAGIKGCQLMLDRKSLVEFTGASVVSLIKE